MNTINVNFIKSSLDEAKGVLDSFITDQNNQTLIANCISECVNSIKQGGTILSCGNGGSMCDSNHFAEELTGYFRKDRAPIKAIAINDAAHISCVANDSDFNNIFSRYIEAFNDKNNILLAISTSGNSKNVINAVEASKKNGMKTIGLLGKSGGQLKEMVDIPIIVDGKNSDRIQEVHIKIIHIIVEGIERELFPRNY